MKDAKERQAARRIEIIIAIGIIGSLIAAIWTAFWTRQIRNLEATPAATSPSISDVLLAETRSASTTLTVVAPETALAPTATLDTTQALLDALSKIDQQFQASLKSNIVFNTVEEMDLYQTVTIELLLNPSASSAELASELVERSDFSTSTAADGQLLNEEGGNVDVVTSYVAVTDRMKAVLKGQEPAVFEIQELHDNAEQPISSVDTTKWRWSVTARKEGKQTLELVLYRLIKYANQDYWREVESYRSDIIVKVTASQRFGALDWKWVLGILATALIIPLFFRWYDNRKKEAGKQSQLTPPRRRYRS